MVRIFDRRRVYIRRLPVFIDVDSPGRIDVDSPVALTRTGMSPFSAISDGASL